MKNELFFNGLLRRRDGIFSSDLLITAVAYLNFFNRLQRKPSGIKRICKDIKIAERPADVMLTFFSSIGLIEKKGEKYFISKNGKMFLSEKSKSDLSGYFKSLQERPICLDILKVLKTDKPMNWSNSYKRNEWAKAMEKKEFAGSFSSAMDSRGTILAPVLASRVNCSNYSKLLDIAGSTGVYSIELVKKNRRLQAAILEKSPVDIIAGQTIRKNGLSKMISVFSADMFSDKWPTGFDMHLFSHVLHDWNIKDVKYLLQKSFDTLESGGLLLIHDAHINGKKTGPVEVAEYSVLLMLSTMGKCYSYEEIKKILLEIGFISVKIQSTTGFRSLITAKKPIN